MSRLRRFWPALRSGGRDDPSGPLERQLERRRPSPDRAFASSLRADLDGRWAAHSRPRALRSLVAGLIVAGVIVLAVALVLAAG